MIDACTSLRSSSRTVVACALALWLAPAAAFADSYPSLAEPGACAQPRHELFTSPVQALPAAVSGSASDHFAPREPRQEDRLDGSGLVGSVVGLLTGTSDGSRDASTSCEGSLCLDGVVRGVGEVVEPVTEEVGSTIEPVVGQVGSVTEPVVAELAPVIQPIAEPVIEPLVGFADPVAQPLLDPLAQPLEPVIGTESGLLDDVTGLLR